MTIQSLAAVKAHLSKYVDDVEQTHERVTITRNGRPAAIIMSVEDLESLEESLDILSDPEAMADIRRSEEEIARGEYFSLEDVTAEWRQQRDGR